MSSPGPNLYTRVRGLAGVKNGDAGSYRTYPDEEPRRSRPVSVQIFLYRVKGYAYQYGDWMHVDRAAPRPVPVQIRMPRLYSVDVFETPANCVQRISGGRQCKMNHTNLQLPGPQSSGWVIDQTAREVTLHTTDHVVVLCVRTLPTNQSASAVNVMRAITLTR